MVNLNFRVASGFHINSNTPKSEFLIPTGLKMDLPTDIVLGKIDYPAGKDLTFPFSPDEKLNVYSGDFAINGGGAPADFGGAGKICDAWRPALPGLRQRPVLPAENAAGEFRSESREGTARSPPQSRPKPARAWVGVGSRLSVKRLCFIHPLQF